MMRTACVALGISALSLQASAQTKMTVENVMKMSLRNSGPIIDQDQIRGYFFFYLSDKVDKKTNEYTLSIVDENLKKIKEIKMQDGKEVSLLEAAYNGSAINFTFFNDKENTLEYRSYKTDGKMAFSYTRELDKKSEKYFKAAYVNKADEDNENKTVNDIPGKGFISITPIREDKTYTYDVNFYSSEKRKTWNFNPTEEGKITAGDFLGATDSVVIIETMQRAHLMSGKTESGLVGLNIETGKQMFNIQTVDKQYELAPMNVTPLQSGSGFLVMGPYYNNGDDVAKAKSQGLAIWQMSSQGKILRSKYLSWQRDLGKFMNVDQRGKLDDIGWLYIHKLVQTSNGKFFVVGEGYKRVADALGIAATALSGSYRGNTTKLKITDMVVLQLNDQFALEDAKVYEKNANNFSLEGGDFASPHTLAIMAKNWGYFDYEYTMMTPDHNGFTASYTDYERSKGYKGTTFNTISFYDNKLHQDKIQLKSEASTMRIMAGKSGYVLVSEYFKKKKTLEVRLEKTN